MHKSENMLYRVILLLGSYDHITEKVLVKLKEQLSQSMMFYHEPILIFLLEDLQIYTADIKDTDDKEYKVILIAERYNNGNKLTLFILDASSTTIVNAEDITIKDASNIIKEIRDYLGTRYTITSFYSLPIFDTLEQLTRIASLVFVLRHRELTRGGEYIELVYLLGRGVLSPSKVYFFKKEGFNLSEMAWEIFNHHKVQFRSYTDEVGLNREAIRILKNYVSNQSYK